MVAYVQYAFMLIWNLMFLVDQVVGQLEPQPYDYGGPSLPVRLGALITIAVLALLAAIGALVSWLIYRALDPVAAQIADLEDQIEELRDEGDDELTPDA